jgi:hypothetical protein
MKNKLIKWFELNWSWLFVNGRKQDAWAEHLRKKYGQDKTKKQNVILFNNPPKCLVCENEMDSIRINRPLCDDCLYVFKELVDKKKKKNDRHK